MAIEIIDFGAKILTITNYIHGSGEIPQALLASIFITMSTVATGGELQY